MNTPNKLKDAFDLQAYHCGRLGSPFLVRFCEIMSERLSPETAVGQQLFDWSGDVSAAGASLPLRLHGCLHRLVLSGESPELATVFPPHHNDVTDDQMWAAFETALHQHEAAILAQLQFAPQTNEVRRSGALFPGFLEIAQQTGSMPFVLSEIGASAGLNLNWNQFVYRIKGQDWGDPSSRISLNPEWKGNTPELSSINVKERAGCDLNPIDLSDTNATRSLLSYLWADQGERLERTRAAIEIAKAHPFTVEKQDAVSWLDQRLSKIHDGHVHIIYHTIAWQYFSEADKQSGKKLIEKAGRAATKSAPIAWLRLEADGQEPGAALTLRVWRGGDKDGDVQFLGRADYHGRWVNWSR